MENNDIEQGQSPSTQAAHHRGHNTCCPDAVCWRAPSHERGHDRFVLHPSSNQPCCTCASSSDFSARGASHGNACHASRRSESRAGHSVCGPGTACLSSNPGTSVCEPLLSAPLVTAWKRTPVAEASPAPAAVSAVPAQLVAPQSPTSAAPGAPTAAAPSPLAVTAPGLKASRYANCRGLRYHPP